MQCGGQVETIFGSLISFPQVGKVNLEDAGKGGEQILKSDQLITHFSGIAGVSVSDFTIWPGKDEWNAVPAFVATALIAPEWSRCRFRRDFRSIVEVKIASVIEKFLAGSARISGSLEKVQQPSEGDVVLINII